MHFEVDRVRSAGDNYAISPTGSDPAFCKDGRHQSLQRRCRSHATLRAQRHHRNLDHNCRTQSSPASQIQFKALWIRAARNAATFRAAWVVHDGGTARLAANKPWRVGFSPREALASLPTSGAEAPRGLKPALQKSSRRGKICTVSSTRVPY